MNVFFGMDVRGSNPNDPIFLLRLPHLWPVFAIPIVCFYTFLTMWVVRKVREATAIKKHKSGQGHPPAGSANREESSDSTTVDETISGPRNGGVSPHDLPFLAAST